MNLPTQRRNLADVLRSHARIRPDALAFADGHTRLTWLDADVRATRVAHALRDAGVVAGDRVLWLGQNSFRLEELLLACCKIGAQLCPANWRQQPDELAFVIDDLAPALVVWQHEEVGDTVAAGRNAARHVARWIAHDDGEYEQWLAAVPLDADDPDSDLAADAPLLLIYTGAFDGRPNAATLPSQALVAQALLMAQWSAIDDQYVFLNSGPLFHIGTFMPNLSTLVSGGTNVFVARPAAPRSARPSTATGAPVVSSSVRWSTPSLPPTLTVATTSRRSEASAVTRRSTRGSGPTRARGDVAPAATAKPK